MERESVESSMMASVGYDIATSTLEIEFKGKSNPVWQYYDFPEHMYHEFRSGSLGKYFLANIKGQYSENRVG